MDNENIRNIIVSPDIIIIDCDKETIPKPMKETKRVRRCKRKRQVKLGSREIEETLVITQKLQVKKQRIKCVIKINNNNGQNVKKEIKFKHKRQSSKSGQDKTKTVHRIVPTCSRPKCQDAIKCKINTKVDTSKRSNHKHSNSKRKERKSRLLMHSKHWEDINDNPVKMGSLSPISLSTLKSDNISYEDISLGSFSCSDTEIDTLIKRTKERERRFTQTGLSCGKPKHSYTAEHFIIISSDEEASNDFKYDNISIHSLATIVLDPPVDDISYSPSKAFDRQSNLKYQNDILSNSFKNTILKVEDSNQLENTILMNKGIKVKNCYSLSPDHNNCLKNNLRTVDPEETLIKNIKSGAV